MAVNSNRRINIWINGEEVENKVGGIRAAMKTLNREIDQCTIGTKEYNDKASKIKELDAVIKEHKKGIEGISHGWAMSVETIAVGLVSAHALMGMFHKAVGMFEESFTAYGIIIEAETKLQISLKGRKEVQESLLKQAKDLQNTTTVKEADIVKVQAFLAAQGRSEEQIKKTTHAAIELSAATGWDLMESAKKADGTMEGFVREIKSLDAGFTTLTKEQLVNGAGVDLLLKKYSGLAEGISEVGAGPLKQLGNVFENLKEIIGGWIAGAILPAIRGLKNFVVGINEALVAKDLTVEFHQQAENVLNLQKNIIPLCNRYDELNGKWDSNTKTLNLNVAEQKELKDIIEKITAVVPGAANEFDKMGNIIHVNTMRVREFVTAEIARLKVMNSSAIIQEYAAMYDIRINLEKNYQHVIKQIKEKGTYKVSNADNEATPEKWLNESVLSFRWATKEEIAETEKKYKNLLEQQLGHKTQLENLNGDAIVNEQKRQDTETAIAKAAEDKRAAYRLLSYKTLAKMRDDGDDLAGEILKEKSKNDKDKKYRLDTDAQFVFVKTKIERDYFTGKIESQKKYEEQLLGLEIVFLIKRLKLKKDDAETTAALQSQLDNKQKQQVDNKNKSALFIRKLAMQNNPIRIEMERNKEAMDLFWSNVGNKNKLTSVENEGLENIQKEHHDKINEIDAKAIAKQLKNMDSDSEAILSKKKADDLKFLNSIETLENAKIYLKTRMSEKELDKINSLPKAKLQIEKLLDSDTSDSQLKELEKTEAQLQDILNKGKLKDETPGGIDSDPFKDVVLADDIFSPEEQKVIKEKLSKVREDISKLKTLSKETGEALLEDENQKNAAKFHEAKKTDMLGFTESDWVSLFTNLKNGKIGVNEIVMAVDALKNSWTAYSTYLAAAENKKNRELEEGNNKEKTALKTKLDKHLITQAAYDSKVLDMDTNLKKQKDTATYNQALRDARLSEISAIQSAAVASIAIWKYGPEIAIPMEILIAGTLAASLATIEANLPTAPAYAEGGFTNGDQIYRAGEKGQEFIASNSLLRDKKTAPVIKWLDQYQRGGKSIPMPIEANFNGMQTAVSNKYSSSSSDGSNQILISMIDHQKSTILELKLLNKYLSDPANRKARIVRDELTRFDGEMATLQSLAKIR